ncbi:MAG: hypothetical protein V3V55_07370, partial [Rhodospirillales bacterium]
GALEDATNIYGKVGYRLKYLNLGKTNFSASWGQSENLGGTDQDVNVAGFNIVQDFDAYGTEIYAGYANFDLETGVSTQDDFEDINAGWVGMRVKF